MHVCSIATGASRASSTVMTTRQKAGSGGDCAGARQHSARCCFEQQAHCTHVVSDGSLVLHLQRLVALQPRVARVRPRKLGARCLRHAAPGVRARLRGRVSTCAVIAPCRSRAPSVAPGPRCPSPRSAADLRASSWLKSWRQQGRTLLCRVPERRNCSRVVGRYQHASAYGHCATSATCAARARSCLVSGAARSARERDTPFGCERP